VITSNYTLGQGASMTILHADGAPHPSPNEDTLVVRLNLGNTRVLLMGDADAGSRQVPSATPTPTPRLLRGADLAARVRSRGIMAA